MLSVKHPDAAPAAFLTVVAPYRGTTPPEVEASLVGNSMVGSDEAQVSVRAFGKQWRIGRNLDKRTAWCEAVANDRVAPSTRPATRRQMPASPFDSRSEHAKTIESRGLRAPAQLWGRPTTRMSSRPSEATSGGNIWVCWVAFDGQADAVLAAKIDGQTASPPVVLSEASGDHWRPAMCTGRQRASLGHLGPERSRQVGHLGKVSGGRQVVGCDSPDARGG